VARFITGPAEMADADLVVLPGTRSTVADLAWLREQGLDVAQARHAAAGGAVLGICGGYQMLGTFIDDPVESGAGLTPGLGLLPVRTHFGPDKILARQRRALPDGTVLEGYEIHHGVVTREGGETLVADEGCRAGAVAGTVWHGLLENDAFRRRYLAEVGPHLRAKFCRGTGHVVRRDPGGAAGPARRSGRRAHRPGRRPQAPGRRLPPHSPAPARARALA
jgi:adenosylcobyric acid synthase